MQDLIASVININDSTVTFLCADLNLTARHALLFLNQSAFIFLCGISRPHPASLAAHKLPTRSYKDVAGVLHNTIITGVCLLSSHTPLSICFYYCHVSKSVSSSSALSSSSRLCLSQVLFCPSVQPCNNSLALSY